MYDIDKFQGNRATPIDERTTALPVRVVPVEQ